MLKINFRSDSDLNDYSRAISEYEEIWQLSGHKIVELLEKHACLKFKESEINAIVYRGISRSHPLSLRDNQDNERKRLILIHELGHRLLAGQVAGGKSANSLQTHKLLFLILHDVFVEFGGREFADSAVEWDSKLPRPEYGEAWRWALDIEPERRKEKFLEVVRFGYGTI